MVGSTRRPNGFWDDKTTEDILKMLKEVLDCFVPKGLIQKSRDLLKVDGGLYAALQKLTSYTRAECFRMVGYGHLVKSDKRDDIASLQEQLGDRPIKIIAVGKKKDGNKNRTAVKYICTVPGCGYQTEDRKFWNNIKGEGGTGCPRCSKREVITNEIHDARLINHFNGSIIRLDDIVNARIGIAHQCLICGYIWYPSPFDIAPPPGGPQNPGGCPGCSGKMPLTNEKHDTRLVFHHGRRIKRVGNIISARQEIEHECMVCGHEWLVEPYNVGPPIEANRKPRGCPRCSGRAELTNEEVDNRLNFWHGGSIVRKDDVVDASTPILHQCMIHDFSWLVTPNHVAPAINAFKATGCALCADLRAGMGLFVQRILKDIMIFLYPEVIVGALPETKEISRENGYVRGIEPDFTIGKTFYDSKLSIRAVFTRSKGGMTSHEKYSPYGQVINVVFEPWPKMESTALNKDGYKIIHVSEFINQIDDYRFRWEILYRTLSILLLDVRNASNGVISDFLKLVIPKRNCYRRP